MRNAIFIIPIILMQMLNAKVGIFEETTNVGNPPIKGSTIYNSADQSYLITGSGIDVWGQKDECHLAYNRVKGDFIATANVEIVAEITHPHQKTGWMARPSLAEGAVYVGAVIHADKHASIQWRPKQGGGMDHYENQRYGTKLNYQILQLERAGNVFTMRAAKPGEPLQEIGSYSPEGWPEEILLGWLVTSHDRDQTNQARVWNVRIDQPVGPDAFPMPTPEEVVARNPYDSGWLGSRLETINVFNGVRNIIHESPGWLEAPNWMPDGERLLFNEEGILYTIPVAGRTPTVVNTGPCDNNNSGHVISFDGKSLAISHDAGKGSAIYTLPIEGGEPTLVTKNTPSYAHGWNPNGKEVVFAGNRNEENGDIYSIPIDGGEEVNLTNIKTGHVDGSEFSPDGKYIYYNGSQTGTMQIWRMKSDGSDTEQITFDENNDWFPHISPDGEWMAYISFPPTIDPDSHPSFKRVTLRLLPLKRAGSSRVIAYLYGGQGTINVPSWSPDSRHLAFVSAKGVGAIQE